MFEQTFKNIDDILWKEAGCQSELDYVEQTSWIIFLKYLDDLETERNFKAELVGEEYDGIIADKFRWETWAAPKTDEGKIDHKKALTGDDLKDFVNIELFPYLRKFKDILFVRVGANRGDCCVIKENVSELNCANIVFARLKEGNVDFIDRYCQSRGGKEQLLGMSVGAAQGVINTQSVAELIIPYPKIKEQERIVGVLNLLNTETKKLESNYQKKLNDLEELKKSILQKAFSGELTAKEIMA